MILALTLAVAVIGAPDATRPLIQAQAVVRIVAAERLHFAELERTTPKRLRDGVVREADGTATVIRLAEFE